MRHGTLTAEKGCTVLEEFQEIKWGEPIEKWNKISVIESQRAFR